MKNDPNPNHKHVTSLFLSPAQQPPISPSQFTQDVGKAAVAATSLKRQKTEQVFSGAVAVMAIIHRPPAPPAGAIPDHPQQTGSHSRTNSSSSSSSSRCLKKRPHRQPVLLHVANVGDCRAVLCRGGDAVVITSDHTPSVPSEAARVEAAGGFVSRGRVNGILGVSRSFGDIHCKVRAEVAAIRRGSLLVPASFMKILSPSGHPVHRVFSLSILPWWSLLPPPVRESLPVEKRLEFNRFDRKRYI